MGMRRVARRHDATLHEKALPITHPTKQAIHHPGAIGTRLAQVFQLAFRQVTETADELEYCFDLVERRPGDVEVPPKFSWTSTARPLSDVEDDAVDRSAPLVA